MKNKLSKKHIELLLKLFYIDGRVTICHSLNLDETRLHQFEICGDFYRHRDYTCIYNTKLNRVLLKRLANLNYIDMDYLDGNLEFISVNINGISFLNNLRAFNVYEYGLSENMSVFVMINEVLRDHSESLVSTSTLVKKFYQRYSVRLHNKGFDFDGVCEAMSLVKPRHVKKIIKLCVKHGLSRIKLYDHKKAISNLRIKKEFIDFQTSMLLSESLPVNQARCVASLPGKVCMLVINVETNNSGFIFLNEVRTYVDVLEEDKIKETKCGLNVVINNLCNRKITYMATHKHVVLNRTTEKFEFATCYVIQNSIEPGESNGLSPNSYTSLGYYIDTIVI